MENQRLKDLLPQLHIRCGPSCQRWRATKASASVSGQQPLRAPWQPARSRRRPPKRRGIFSGLRRGRQPGSGVDAPRHARAARADTCVRGWASSTCRSMRGRADELPAGGAGRGAGAAAPNEAGGGAWAGSRLAGEQPGAGRSAWAGAGYRDTVRPNHALLPASSV